MSNSYKAITESDTTSLIDDSDHLLVNDEWTESINAYGTYAPDGATLSSTAISLLDTIQTSNIAALIEELSS